MDDRECRDRRLPQQGEYRRGSTGQPSEVAADRHLAEEAGRGATDSRSGPAAGGAAIRARLARARAELLDSRGTGATHLRASVEAIRDRISPSRFVLRRAHALRRRHRRGWAMLAVAVVVIFRLRTPQPHDEGESR